MSERKHLMLVDELAITDFVRVEHKRATGQLVMSDDDQILMQVQPPQPLREVPDSVVERMASVFWPYRSARDRRVQGVIIESLRNNADHVRAAIAANAIWVVYTEQIGQRTYRNAALLAGLDLGMAQPRPLHRSTRGNRLGIAPSHMKLPDAPIHILVSE